MRPNTVKRRFRDGLPTAVGWQSTPDPYVAETMAQAGFDALVLDMQHGMGIGPDRAAQWLQVVSTTEVMPIVRVPWNEPVYIQWALDAGAYGVIVPLVNTYEEAAKAGGARHYAGPDYTQHANEEILCLVMVEHPDTVGRVHELAKAPGIDGFYIGPSDLAVAMGVSQQDPRHAAARRRGAGGGGGVGGGG